MEVFVKIPKKKITNKTFMIVYLNKVDFRPSQSFLSKNQSTEVLTGVGFIDYHLFKMNDM